jgi:hypothetical protein
LLCLDQQLPLGHTAPLEVVVVVVAVTRRMHREDLLEPDPSQVGCLLFLFHPPLLLGVEGNNNHHHHHEGKTRAMISTRNESRVLARKMSTGNWTASPRRSPRHKLIARRV